MKIVRICCHVVIALDFICTAVYLYRNRAAVKAWFNDKEPFDSSWMDKSKYLDE